MARKRKQVEKVGIKRKWSCETIDDFNTKYLEIRLDYGNTNLSVRLPIDVYKRYELTDLVEYEIKRLNQYLQEHVFRLTK